jgi:putative transposase
MPRSARVVIANQPHHIIQRGHNRQVVFAQVDDYEYYLDTLREWKEKLGCKVYAYCLMTNHAHLVIDPGKDSANLALLMKRVAGRYTRYINKKEKRTGTVWEGRYKSSPVSSGEYLLACCRYVELNPIRAGIVADPGHYRWSSCKTKTGVDNQQWLDIDPFYMSLGESPRARQCKYREWLQDTIPEEELRVIRQSVQRNQLTGSKRYIDTIEKKIGKRVEFRGQGRPRQREK